MLSNVEGKAILSYSFLSSYPIAKLGFHLLKYIVPLQNVNQVLGSFLPILLYSFL